MTATYDILNLTIILSDDGTSTILVVTHRGKLVDLLIGRVEALLSMVTRNYCTVLTPLTTISYSVHN